MTRDFAAAWGRDGIRVNCVCPGPTRTPVVEASYTRGERNPQTMFAITGVVLPVDAGTLSTQLWSLYGGVSASQAG